MLDKSFLLKPLPHGSLSLKSDQYKTLLNVRQDAKPDISVITVTNKPQNLIHIATQLIEQKFDGILEHIIIMDGKDLDSELISQLQKIYKNKGIQLLLIKANPQPERYLFEKLGALRNHGADIASGEMFAFWDDDNRWDKNHLQSLYAPLKEQPTLKAAYSWRRLYTKNSDGNYYPKPIEKDKYPWITDNPRNSKKMYDIQIAAGILASGSHETHDLYGYDGGTACCVDTGEWLFRSIMFTKSRIRFSEKFPLHWQMFGYTDDQVLGLRMLQQGILPSEVYRSEKSTLLYTLGGCSQNHSLQPADSDLKIPGAVTSTPGSAVERNSLNFSSFSARFRNDIAKISKPLLELTLTDSKSIRISVVTVTNKPENLTHLGHQIAGQKFTEKLEHIIVTDGKDISEEIRENLEYIYKKHNIQLKIFKTEPQPNRYLFEKLGALRNYGVTKTSGEFLAFWDDDNRWHENHLQSLYTPLNGNKEIKAAHSWRKLYNRDGSDYKVEHKKYPWITDNPRNSERMYDIQVQAGILQFKSQETHDIYGYFQGTACCVDTGEWLLRRSMFNNQKTKFDENLPLHKQMFGYTDDQILGLRMLKNGISPSEVYCSNQCTLLYSLGGCSQVHTATPLLASSSRFLQSKAITSESINESVKIISRL